MPTYRIQPSSILLGTLFAPKYNLARTCVKNRFLRLGAQFHPRSVFFTTAFKKRHDDEPDPVNLDINDEQSETEDEPVGEE